MIRRKKKKSKRPLEQHVFLRNWHHELSAVRERVAKKKHENNRTGDLFKKTLHVRFFLTLHMLVCVHVLLQQFLTANGHCGLLLNCVQPNCAEKREKQNTPKKVTAISFRSKDEGVSKATWKFHEAKEKKMTFPRSIEATTRNQQQQKRTQQGKERHYRAFDSAAAHSQNRHFFLSKLFKSPLVIRIFFLRGKKTRSSHLFKNTLCWWGSCTKTKKRNKKKKEWRYNGVEKKNRVAKTPTAVCVFFFSLFFCSEIQLKASR